VKQEAATKKDLKKAMPKPELPTGHKQHVEKMHSPSGIKSA
jgi:hypothetical protein